MFNLFTRRKKDIFSIIHQWSNDKNRVKRIIASTWRNLVMEARYRLSGSFTFSIAMHGILIIMYLGLGVLDQPVEPPIREITFIDLNEIEEAEEKEVITKPPVPIIPRELTQTVTPDQPEPEITSQPEQSTISLGNERLFLDNTRTQAPLNLEQYEPVSGGISQSKDILNVSPAIGLKNDQQIAKPAAIDLGGDKGLQIASSSPSTGALAFDLSNKSQIDLKPGQGSGVVSPRPTDLQPAKPEPQPQEPDIKPRETQTFITGQLAKRGILEKVIPSFPPWARKQGVGATISLRFTVMENGVVKETVIVERTSGSLQWDQMVIDALKRWKFVPLDKTDARQDETGVITFQFVI